MTKRLNMSNHFIETENSLLLVVDVQVKLIPLIRNHEKVVESCCWLTSLASDLGINVIFTEQYAKGLGPTVDVLKQCSTHFKPHDKTCFSVIGDEACSKAITDTSQRQIIICGIESAVCILQTVVDLIKLKYEVFVVCDAVGSRHELDNQIALDRMKSIGANIVTKEMVLFEWIRGAEHPMFKEISKKYLQ